MSTNQITDLAIKNWKKAQELGAVLPCPRCGKLTMKISAPTNALSRRADIYICDQCGMEEAVEDASGNKIELEDWFLMQSVFAKSGSNSQIDKDRFEIFATPSTKFYVTKEDIDDIMCAALEGGINYWCNCAEVVEKEYLGEFASEQISRGGSLRLYDCEEDEQYILDRDKFMKGLSLATMQRFDKEYFCSDGRIEAFMIDASDADAIVQYSLFGEVVYG